MRVVKLTKYLRRMGWEIHVLTVRNPDVWRQLGPMETQDGIEVTRTLDPLRLDWFAAAYRKLITSAPGGKAPGTAALGGRGVMVPEFQVGWLATARGAAVRLARRWGATHILATGPPFTALIAAAIAAERTGLPFLADLRDSWTLDPSTRYPAPALAMFDHALERFVLDKAGKVVVVTHAIRRQYVNHYPEYENKFITIPNGFDPEDFPRAQVANDGPFPITYTGSFYPRPPPTTLLLAAQHLAARGVDLRVEFYGRPDPGVAAQVARLKLDDVVWFHGFRPLREAVEAATRSNLLYLLMHTHYPQAMSDKLFMYLATGLPILYEGPDGEAVSFLLRWNANVRFVQPGNVDQMEAEILDAMRYDYPTLARRDILYWDAYGRMTQAKRLDTMLGALSRHES